MVQVPEKHKQGVTTSGECHAEARWTAVIDDVLVPMPRREVPVSVLRSQIGLPDEFVLVRDHNSPEDVVLGDDETIDLGDGNVFYRVRRCDVQPRGHCSSPAKLAFVIDDRFELSTNTEQAGKSLLALFGLPPHTKLVRDFESPNDEAIDAEETLQFTDGPVFVTRVVEASLRITVNFREFTEEDGVRDEMTGAAIAGLVYPESPRNTVVRLQTPDGDREVGHDEVIPIRGCEVFDVTRCQVVGGFEASRVELEVEQLRANGAEVSVVREPTPAVIYHGLRTPEGCSPATEDVLVPIPGAYPGQMLDWAYLPVGSKLIGRVEGSPQGHQIKALGRQWQQISYHPHKGGGGPAWNPMLHGFHSYVGEVMSWLRKAK